MRAALVLRESLGTRLTSANNKLQVNMAEDKKAVGDNPPEKLSPTR